jgi:hypothetical protein
VRLISQSRDAGRERMLIGVLRSLGAVSEGSTANAAKVIAARGVVPAFQLLGSRLPAVRQVRAAGCTETSCSYSAMSRLSDCGLATLRPDAQLNQLHNAWLLCLSM